VKKTRRSPIPDVGVEDEEVPSDCLVSSGRASASSSRDTNGAVKKRPSQKDRSPEEAQRVRKLGREGHERRKRERAEIGAQLHFVSHLDAFSSPINSDTLLHERIQLTFRQINRFESFSMLLNSHLQQLSSRLPLEYSSPGKRRLTRSKVSINVSGQEPG
jgi:hypothetical protein